MAEDRVMLKKKQLDTLLNSVTLFHSSLDIQTILRHFSQTLKKLLSYDSLAYANSKIEKQFILGTVSQYTSRYDLTLDKTSLGEMIFTRQRPFQEEELLKLEEQLCLLLTPLKNAITHHEALHAALHDPLTSLLNRGSLNQTLKREIGLALRHNYNLCLIILDLDDFKKINDKYGHIVGDKILCKTATILEQSIRETDYAFRIGGEEFLLLLVNSSTSSSKILAARIKDNIEKANQSSKNKAMPKVTASLGMTNYLKDENQQAFISRADKAMYRAKAKGKNNVHISK